MHCGGEWGRGNTMLLGDRIPPLRSRRRRCVIQRRDRRVTLEKRLIAVGENLNFPQGIGFFRWRQCKETGHGHLKGSGGLTDWHFPYIQIQWKHHSNDLGDREKERQSRKRATLIIRPQQFTPELCSIHGWHSVDSEWKFTWPLMTPLRSSTLHATFKHFRLLKERKKADKQILTSQERAFWKIQPCLVSYETYWNYTVVYLPIKQFICCYMN